MFSPPTIIHPSSFICLISLSSIKISIQVCYPPSMVLVQKIEATRFDPFHCSFSIFDFDHRTGQGRFWHFLDFAVVVVVVFHWFVFKFVNIRL